MTNPFSTTFSPPMLDFTENDPIAKQIHRISDAFNKLSGISLTVSSANLTQFSPLDYGAQANGVTKSDITTTLNSAVISSKSRLFTQADVGKLITIAGAGAASAVLNTSISSVSAQGKATLATAASTAIAGTGIATFGTDDTVALQAAVNAASAAGGGLIVLPTGIMIVSSITWASNVSMQGNGPGKSILKHIKTTDMVGAVVYCTTNGQADCQFKDFEIDCEAATNAVYSVNSSGIRIPYALRPTVDYVYVHGAPATGIALDGAVMGRITNNLVVNCGRLNSGNPGGAGIGCAVDTSSGIASFVVTGNICVQNKVYGIFFEAEASNETVDANVICNNNIILMNSSSIAGIGDCGSRRFECVGNHINGSTTGPGGGGGTGQNTGDGITVTSGTLGFDPGEQGLIADNVITSVGGNGISINYTVGIPSGQVCAYEIRNNKIQASAGNGVAVTANASTALVSVDISDNQVQSSGTSGIVLTGAGGFTDTILKGNVLFNNGLTGSGITACAVAVKAAITRFRMIGNVIYDDGTGTQLYALGVNTSIAIAGAFIADNDFQNNATGAIDLIGGATIAGTVINNKGYNPVGISAATNVPSSPGTVTAGNSPETHYLNQSATNTATVTKGGQAIATLAGASTYYLIDLQPGESYIVTWATTNPTYTKDVH